MIDDPTENADWLRLEEHFPDDADITLQVLKGHLLVEELLREVFDLLLANPDALKGNGGKRFDCHEIICLVQSMSEHSAGEPWLWPAAKRLNNIRNDLAHNLQPKALDAKVGSLIKSVTQDNPVVKGILDRLGIPQGMEFKAVILAMCGCLSAFKRLIQHEKSGAATSWQQEGHQ